ASSNPCRRTQQPSNDCRCSLLSLLQTASNHTEPSRSHPNQSPTECFPSDQLSNNLCRQPPESHSCTPRSTGRPHYTQTLWYRCRQSSSLGGRRHRRNNSVLS